MASSNGQFTENDPRASNPKLSSRITNHAKRQLKRDWFHYFAEGGGAFVQECPDGMTVAQFCAAVMIDRALKGEFPWFKELLDRTEGKVPQRIAGADGKNLPRSITVIEVLGPQVTITGTVLEAVSRVIETSARELPAPDEESAETE